MKPVIIYLLSTLFVLSSFAQDTTRSGEITTGNGVHRRKLEFPPKALLVQLRSEQSRIKYFESHYDNTDAERVRNEAAKIRSAMIHDFRDHFSFCPVYYYIDTNAQLIKEQKFNGVLFNADGITAKNIVISPGDTDYFIVYYGYPENENTELYVMPGAGYKYGSGNVMGRGLIFLNYKYEQRDYYYIIHNFRSLFYRYLNHDYEFYSKKFDMEYRPKAKNYNDALYEYYGAENKNDAAEGKLIRR